MRSNFPTSKKIGRGERLWKMLRGRNRNKHRRQMREDTGVCRCYHELTNCTVQYYSAMTETLTQCGEARRVCRCSGSGNANVPTLILTNIRVPRCFRCLASFQSSMASGTFPASHVLHPNSLTAHIAEDFNAAVIRLQRISPSQA